jgi:hypothetical protein
MKTTVNARKMLKVFDFINLESQAGWLKEVES